jgi:outer membrane lipoprotein-sorting protein
MNEKSKKYIIVGLILLLVVGFIAYKNVTKIQNYKKNGKEVECTVVSVIQGRKGKQSVEAAYYDEAGNLITADVIRNQKTYVGEEFIGMVVPEKPEEIYCMPSESTQKIVYCVFGAFGLTGLILIICGIVSAVKHRKVYY